MTGQADNGADPGARERLAALIEQALPGKLLRVASHTDELTYEVGPADLLQAAATLRDGAGLEFEMCMDVCGVDYLEYGHAQWKTEHATLSGFSRGVAPLRTSGAELAPGRRFAVVYHLLSIARNQRVAPEGALRARR